MTTPENHGALSFIDRRDGDVGKAVAGGAASKPQGDLRVSVAQSCPTLCSPVDCSPPGSSVHGILQARILEWVAIFFLGDLPNPGVETGSPALQADSFTV